MGGAWLLFSLDNRGTSKLIQSFKLPSGMLSVFAGFASHRIQPPNPTPPALAPVINSGHLRIVFLSAASTLENSQDSEGANPEEVRTARCILVSKW